MELINMNYKGVNLLVNPSSINAKMARRLGKRAVLFSSTRVQDVSFEPTIISGKGMLVGSDARQQAHNLMRVFKSKGSGYLFAPDYPPIKAFFSDLSISFNSQQNSVSYSFEFVEDCNDKSSVMDFGYTYALDGETLYDVANRTNVSIEKIFDSNDFCNLFSVKGGDKVWLC